MQHRCVSSPGNPRIPPFSKFPQGPPPHLRSSNSHSVLHTGFSNCLPPPPTPSFHLKVTTKENLFLLLLIFCSQGPGASPLNVHLICSSGTGIFFKNKEPGNGLCDWGVGLGGVTSPLTLPTQPPLPCPKTAGLLAAPGTFNSP